jgi:LysM repeat protein
MEIEDEIDRHVESYGVDVDLALAVCLYESGGNRNLSSSAGAQGYFQVMPATFQSLRVDTNIEAGVKYLSRMIERFGREDFALAAYNGGPSRVSQGRPPLESLQYVLGVGHYRSVLKLHARSIRHHAEQMSLVDVREGDTWWSISERTGMSILQLRLHNPFLSTRALQIGQTLAIPPSPRADLFSPADDDIYYTTRHGDNYFNLAFTLGVNLDALRDANSLWRLQTLPAGQILRIPLARTEKYNEHQVERGETLKTIADARNSQPWQIIRDNVLFWNESINPGMVVKVRPEEPKPIYLTHHVASGDTLGALASHYVTSIGAIQSANALGQNTTIKIGQRLRIPARASE